LQVKFHQIISGLPTGLLQNPVQNQQQPAPNCVH